MSQLLDTLECSMAMAGRVIRYHTFPTIHQQSVGEHTDRVITLYIDLFGVPNVEVLVYIAYHDKGEYYSGDLPFSAKRENEDLKKAMNKAETKGLKKLGLEMPTLTEKEWVKFKAADMLEMYEFASTECMMGNKYGLGVKENIVKGLGSLLKEYPTIRELTQKWINKHESGIS